MIPAWGQLKTKHQKWGVITIALIGLLIGFWPQKNGISADEPAKAVSTALERPASSVAPLATASPAPAGDKPAVNPSPAATASVAAASAAAGQSNAAIGVYTGPGAIAAHTNFEQWLGRPVPYALDYIDYKGGWQKDFIDSRLWLAEPWGRWVGQRQGRRLVLGLPMLETENDGQFDRGVAGDFDNYFRALATNLVQHNLGSSIIRLGYEANCDTIGPWQATGNPAGYVKLYRHLVGVLQSVPAAAFKFDWTVCNGLQTGRALDSFDSFYPGDDVVDIMGMDIYDVKWQDPAATAVQRWEYISSRRLGINEFWHFASAHQKPVSYPEWGLYKPGDSFAGGGDDPHFISQMSNLIQASSPIYQSYFNLDWGGGVLSDFVQGQAAFKRLFGD